MFWQLTRGQNRKMVFVYRQKIDRNLHSLYYYGRKTCFIGLLFLSCSICWKLVILASAGVSDTQNRTTLKDAFPVNVFNYSAFGVPVYVSFVFSINGTVLRNLEVMMPLSSVTISGDLVQNYDGYDLQWILKQWKRNGVYGLMVDVWFGIVEKRPKEYHWEPYIQLCQHLREAGLKLQTVMSFHR